MLFRCVHNPTWCCHKTQLLSKCLLYTTIMLDYVPFGLTIETISDFNVQMYLWPRFVWLSGSLLIVIYNDNTILLQTVPSWDLKSDMCVLWKLVAFLLQFVHRCRGVYNPYSIHSGSTISAIDWRYSPEEIDESTNSLYMNHDDQVWKANGLPCWLQRIGVHCDPSSNLQNFSTWCIRDR